MAACYLPIVKSDSRAHAKPPSANSCKQAWCSSLQSIVLGSCSFLFLIKHSSNILSHTYLFHTFSGVYHWDQHSIAWLTNMDTEKQTKKVDVEGVDGSSSADGDSASPVISLTPMQYRKLIWKLDLRLLPPLFALWFVSLVDRINIGSAKIFGIEKDLHMNIKGNDFNIALIIVTIGLITMEVPSNYLLKRTSPSIVLATQSLLLGESKTFTCLLCNSC